MSQMSTVPVFACRRCGKPVYVTHLSTRVDDPEGKVLESLMKGLADIALCKECQRVYNWYARQNRLEEWHKNFFNPEPVLYNVHDDTGVDWYGRNRN